MPRSQRRNVSVRWWVLLLGATITFGDYYCFDLPSALHNSLKDSFSNIDSSKFEIDFNLLYSVYSIPSLISPIIGGYLTDIIGVRIMIILYSLVVLLGQVIIAFACSFKSMQWMLFGRAVFGICGDTLVVAQSALVSAWFQGRELAFAMGFNLALSRLGSVANDILSPYLVLHGNVALAFWFGALFCMISLIFAIALICVDKIFHHKKMSEDILKTPTSPIRSIDSPLTPQYSPVSSTVNAKQPAFRLNPDGTVVPYSSINTIESKLHEKSTYGSTLSRIEEKKKDEEQALSLTDIKNFSLSYWLLVCCGVMTYSGIMPFNNIANALLISNFFPVQIDKPVGVSCSDSIILPEWVSYCTAQAESQAKAGFLQSIPFMISAILAPLLGIVIDNFGHRTLFIFISPFTLSIAHILLVFKFPNPVFPLILLGFSYSVIAAVLWPSVMITVQPKLRGTALGVLSCLQNVSSIIFPVIVARITNIDSNFHHVEIFFTCLSLLGIFVAGFLVYVDEKNDAYLRKTTSKDIKKRPRRIGRPPEKSKFENTSLI